MSDYSVKVLIQAVDRVTAPLRGIARMIDGLGKHVAFRQMQQSWKAISRASQGFSRELGIMTGRFTALGAAAAAAGFALFKPAAELENMRFAMDNLLESESKGGAYFDRILNFAQKSPYGIQQVADMVRLMLTYDSGLQGFANRFEGLLSFIGTRNPDAVSAQNAILAMGQAFSLGKLQMDNFKQAIQNGLPVMALLKEVTGKNEGELQKMMKAGEITRPVMNKLFDLMIKKGLVAGDKVTGLLSTKLSNLGDIWTRFAYSITKMDLGKFSLIGDLKKDLDTLTGFLTGGLDDSKLRQIGLALSGIYKGVKESALAILPMIQAVGNLTGALINLVGGPGNATKLLFLYLTGPAILTGLNLLSVAVKGIFDIFMMLPVPVRIAVVVIGGIIGLGKLAYDHWTPFRNFWDGLVGVIRNAYNAVVGFTRLPLPKWSAPTVSQTVQPVMGAIPKRALGGSVAMGKPYLVGERGPEMFVPGASGGIVPNNRMGGGGVMTLNLNISQDRLAQVTGFTSSNPKANVNVNIGRHMT